jgi:hypothetical protein
LIAGHKFNVSISLSIIARKEHQNCPRPRGAYKITKLLPERDEELQYRIKSAVETHERIALESEQAAL